MTRANGVAPGSERAAMTIPSKWRARFLAMAAGRRGPNVKALPRDLGRPLALVATDAHGEVERYLSGLEALPAVFPTVIDLGDKLDRGPEPLAMNQLLAILNPTAHRLIGNHDAMWIGAGLGIERLAIELVRWLMRYNEQDFLVNEMGIDLTPLEEYAQRNFQDARGHFKAKLSQIMEAAATYLKIIAEAPYRFPEHRETQLNESDLKIRAALFHSDAIESLDQSERDIFDRLTGDAKLDPKDASYFYRLVGGLREFTDEESGIVKYFTKSFMENKAYFQLIECMVGRGDIYSVMRMSEGAPVDILLTHAGIPITEDGFLAMYNGLKGKEAFDAIENDVRMSFNAWRWFIETGDNALMEVHEKAIDRIGELAWGATSPLYMREMQTAARAVLEKGSGLYAEPEQPFFTQWVGSHDSPFVHRVCREVSSSFGLDPRRLTIVHGHKPNKDGGAVVSALGHDLNIDTGASENYGHHGMFLLIGTNSFYEFQLDTHEFKRVELFLEAA